jgi:hypothetical protein
MVKLYVKNVTVRQELERNYMGNDKLEVAQIPEKQIATQQLPEKTEVAKTSQPSPSAVTLHNFIQQAGTLKLTENQLKILLEEVDPDEVEIRPDGIVYISSANWENKLNRIPGIAGKWRLIPMTPSPTIQNDCVLWTHYLIIDNAYVSHSVGSCEYRAGNPNMNYGDAVEGCIGNALMRCLKRMGMNRELWDKRFIESWKAKYAEQYTDQTSIDRSGKPKKFWRKKIAASGKPEDYHRKHTEDAIKDFCAGQTKPAPQLPETKPETPKGVPPDDKPAPETEKPQEKKPLSKQVIMIKAIATGLKLSRKDGSWEKFMASEEVKKVCHGKGSSLDLDNNEASGLIEILNGIQTGLYNLTILPDGSYKIEFPPRKRGIKCHTIHHTNEYPGRGTTR